MKSLIATASVCVALITTTSPALATPHHRVGTLTRGICQPARMIARGYVRQLLTSLNLTREQRIQLGALARSYAPEVKSDVEAVATARKALRQAIHQTSFDEAGIIAASTALASAIQNFALTRGKLFSEFAGLLDESQLSTLQSALAKGEEAIDAGLTRILAALGRS